jgi:ribosome-binding protein aMBF1 (putative translation factor)
MKEKLVPFVSNETSKTYQEMKNRLMGRAHLAHSQAIALLILGKLDELGWTQKELAIKMGVSPQQVAKIVKGTENLTLESILKIEGALGLEILSQHITTPSPK